MLGNFTLESLNFNDCVPIKKIVGLKRYIHQVRIKSYPKHKKVKDESRRLVFYFTSELMESLSWSKGDTIEVLFNEKQKFFFLRKTPTRNIGRDFSLIQNTKNICRLDIRMNLKDDKFLDITDCCYSPHKGGLVVFLET